MAESTIPVISAVGHETDFTICDFVADMRAPTPSAAAEIAVRDKEELLSYINQLDRRCKNALCAQAEYKENELLRLRTQLYAYGPQNQLESMRQSLDMNYSAMHNALLRLHEKNRATLSSLAGKLDALSPLRILSGGYAAVEYKSSLVSQNNMPAVGEEIKVITSNAEIRAQVKTVCTVQKGGIADG